MRWRVMKKNRKSHENHTEIDALQFDKDFELRGANFFHPKISAAHSSGTQSHLDPTHQPNVKKHYKVAFDHYDAS